eukprot:CAMPEP_0183747012 /NCGR_PEP_ID=MMETSP0737-20130205/67047_1 /TAXON_ID=385413 /ORGANISM="Thalassiosira miniscula, Strain CCMP1093" /LENGTH=232 /DNA_ID=CAMNT_0025982719 /DNA_START=992 /DNA_END=1690 /DNA_ORIENTATION=+
MSMPPSSAASFVFVLVSIKACDCARNGCVRGSATEGFAKLSKALLLDILNLSAASAPLEVPSFDLTGFSLIVMSMPPSSTASFVFVLVSIKACDGAYNDCIDGATSSGFAKLSKALLLAILNLSAASAPLEVPSFDLIGFSSIMMPRPFASNVSSTGFVFVLVSMKARFGTGGCCIGGAASDGFAMLFKAFLLAILNLSAASAPLDVPSFDLTGFSETFILRPDSLTLTGLD